MEILDQAFEAVRTFRPLSPQEVQSLLKKTAALASNGAYEPFKTSSLFDATAQHTEWLGEESKRTQELMPPR
jgi:hypothetical protein